MSYDTDGGGDPYQASTDFEKFDHAAMLDMIQNADPAKVIALAQKLDAVGTKTDTIATDLQTHMGKVDWVGKGGDAFRDWGTRVASATMTLSDYSSNASVFMLNAGQVLSEVQRDMPQVPSIPYHTVTAYRAKNGLDGHYSDTAGVTPSHLDGAYGPYNADPSAAEYKSAQASLETSRSLAVDQMNKLGQAYNMATDVIKTSPEPTFPPTPGTIMPARPTVIDGSSQYVDGSTDSGGTRGSSKVPVQHIAVPVDSIGLDGNGKLPHVNDTSAHLDSVTTLPITTTSGPTQLPLPVGPVSPPASPPGLPVTPLPLPTNLISTSTRSMPTVDPRTLSAARSAAEREAQGLNENTSGYGPLGGRGPLGERMPVERVGGLGSEEPPLNSTIMGGRASQRPSAFGGEENAIPRGTVMGGGGGGGAGSGAYPTSSGFGGRSRAGAVGERFGVENEGGLGLPSNAGPRAGRNFTPGGEGLSRTSDQAADRIADEPSVGERGAAVQEREQDRRSRRRRGRHARAEHDQHAVESRNPADGEEMWPAPE